MEQHLRFRGADWYSEETPESMIVGGCGGIGSWLVMLLARANFNVFVYDYDTIESHNLGGQLFSKAQVGMYKVSGIKETVLRYSNKNVEASTSKITGESPHHFFMFSAFDNMKARRDMFNVWKKSWENCAVTPIFVDGRLEMEFFQVFFVTPDWADEYESQHLFSDDEVSDEILGCTAKQTSHVAARIASEMTSGFTNHIANINAREDIRVVPKMVEGAIAGWYYETIF